MHKGLYPVLAAFAGLGFSLLASAPAAADPASDSCGVYAQSNLTMNESDVSPPQLPVSCFRPHSLHAAQKVKSRRLAHSPAGVANRPAQPQPVVVVNSPSAAPQSAMRLSSIDCYGAHASLLCPGYQLVGINY